MGKTAARRALAAAIAIAFVSASNAYAADSSATHATVTVRNETGYYLVAVNTAAEAETGWGESLLGEDMAIRPFRERDVRVESGYATLRAVFDVEGTEVEIIEQADFEAGVEYVWTITEDAIWESYGGGYDTYGYYDDTYGYYDGSYGYYGDTYGYYDGSYGYYGE